MSYLALYRKYRPKHFDDFAGQKDISSALKYQVKTDTFGHSYIFNGIRGTGKTSMAKAFAKAINCSDNRDGNACCKCDSCKAFENSSLIDVIEIDAASNNGVDDIRSLRESTRYLPTYSKYKVYIIDEVQMLSNNAFNALLKVFEEPPKNVVFILATTQMHKIPETILSRAQKYNFKRIPDRDMVGRLAYICDKEKIKYTKEALLMIASHSSGSLRDAISHMEKTLSTSNGDINEEKVEESLGLLSSEIMRELFISIVKKELNVAIERINEQILSGKEVSSIFNQFLSFLRAILLKRYVKNDEVVMSVSGFKLEENDDVFSEVTSEEIFKIMEVFSNYEKGLRFTDNTKLAIEMAFYESVLIERKEEENREKTQQKKKVVHEKSKRHSKPKIKDLMDHINIISSELFELLKGKKMIVGKKFIVEVNAEDYFDYTALNKDDMKKLIADSCLKVYKKKLEVEIHLIDDISTEEKLNMLIGNNS